MDTRRKAILWTCALLILATCLYPPWVIGFNQISVGYAWLFHPAAGARVDLSRLAVTWVIIAVVGAALYAAWPTAMFAGISVSASTKRTVGIITEVLVIAGIVLLIAAWVKDAVAEHYHIPQLRDWVWWVLIAFAFALYTSLSDRKRSK